MYVGEEERRRDSGKALGEALEALSSLFMIFVYGLCRRVNLFGKCQPCYVSYWYYVVHGDQIKYLLGISSQFFIHWSIFQL